MANSISEKRPGEFALIAKLFAPLSKNAPGAFGLTDDAALIKPRAGHEQVITADALVEGVHFLRTDPPDTIARKALRVNLSDLAAKGAEPEGYLLTLALPDWPDMTWLENFARGLGEDQNEFGLALFGGDTTSTPGPLTIAITAFGWVPLGQMLRRSGAKPGDLVFVSGTVGDGGGGLAVLKNNTTAIPPKNSDCLINRYRLPSPRLALGKALRGIASAALDVSDGLIADLGHIADVSGAHIAVDASRIPLSDALKSLWGNGTEAAAGAATSGDDYEIAFTAPASARDRVLAAAQQAATAITEIGRVEAGHGVALIDSAGHEVPLARQGFTHF